MNELTAWKVLEPDVASVFEQSAAPLDDLAAGNTPAIVLRGAFPPAACADVVERLIDRDLLFDPRQPIPDAFLQQAIPEGYYREGRQAMSAVGQQVDADPQRTRIDVGTSLGYRGSDRDAFFAHSRQTRQLFDELFDQQLQPIEVLYQALQRLSLDKQVMTARESDGRMYGPAIIRAHYGGYTYRPHFDSVRLREKRSDYVVHEFEHQFAGVLVLQNTQLEEATAQCVLHRCLWHPDVDPSLQSGTFHQYAREHGVEHVEVHLHPGDLYFFNTRSIHEVPGVAGNLPRIVLATFIGYSPDRPEIYVWS